MRKKGYWVLLAILLSVCMLFAFAGCDPNGSGEESGGNGNNSSVVDPNGGSENDEGNGGNGEQKPEEHKHSYTADNVCSTCGKKWEYTEGLEYTLDEETNTFSVTGIGTANGDVVFPYGYRGKYVTSIGKYAFYKCSWLTSIVIPDSVTEIGDEAFEYCSGLTGKLIIPDGVTSIGNQAFGHCSGLTGELIIPDGVTKIDLGAFEYCSGLTGKLIIPDGVTSIGEYAFAYCSGLTGELKIPDSVTEIVEGAFYYCSGLTSVTIGNGVTSIGDNTFYNCSGLTGELIIPDSVTSIGDYAFGDCSNLTSVTIGNGVTSIGAHAFYKCSKLTSVHITDLAAWCKIDFENYNENYNANPLYYAEHLYLNGKEVTELTIPEGITEIKADAFGGCIGLESIVIPDSVTSIGGAAFSQCSGLTSVTIGSGVTEIGKAAFAGCYKLAEVWNYSELEITKGSSDNGDVALYAVSVYKTDEESKQVITDDGYIFYEDEENSYLLGYQGTETTLTLPEKSPKGKNYAIYQYAFYYCDGLTGELKIPDGVTSIGDCAFYDCSGLASITIPDSVTSIGSYAFSYPQLNR